MNTSTLRKITGDLFARKGRTLLVSLSILIGVMGVVTLVSASDILISQLNEDIKTDELAMYNAMVGLTGNQEVRDPSPYLDALRELEGVTDIEGGANYQVVWRAADETRFRKSDVYASTEPFEQADIRPTRLMEGEYPQPGQNELAVEIRMAEKHGIEAGDALEIRMAGEQLETWTVTGLLFHPYNDQNYSNTIYANYDDVLYMAGATSINAIYVRFVDYPTALRQTDAFNNTLAQNTPFIVLLNRVDDPEESMQVERLADLTNILTALGIVAMLVSGFLVINVVNNLVVEQRRQIGVMKSLGTTRAEALIVYSGIVVSYGLIGMVPGVALGIPAAYELAQMVGDSAGTYIQEFTVSGLGIGLGVALGILVPVLAAAIPVFNGTRVSILEAMTDLGIGGGFQAGPLARFIRMLPTSTTIKQSLTNVVQKKGRLLLAVFTLGLAATSFMGVSAVFVNLDQTIGKVVNTFDYHIEVQPAAMTDFEAVQGLLLDNVEELAKVYPGAALSGSVEGYISPLTDSSQLLLMGVETNEPLINLDLRAGSAWENDPEREGIVLSNGVANQLGKGVGDTLAVSLAGTRYEVEIIGTANFAIDAGFMRWQTLSEYAGFVQDGQPVPNIMLLTLHEDEPSVAEVDTVLSKVDEVLARNQIAATLTNQVEFAEGLSQQVLSIGAILNLASGIMAAVGAIGLLTTLSIAVFERQKEIGIMRSVGATSPVIISQFMIEGVLVGLLAWVAAVPLSIALAHGLNAMLPFEDLVEFAFPRALLPIGLVGILIIAAISSIWPSVVAARKTVSDILRYQ